MFYAEITEILGSDQYLGLYFSAFYIIMDENKRLFFCNAGHQRSYLLRRDRKKIASLNTEGFLVGITSDERAQYQTKTINAESGDKIVLYTDGIVEARDAGGDEFGVDRIIKNISKNYSMSGEKMLNSITDDLKSFTNIDDMKDDATLIVIDIK
jgi:sigma-B regulation protein RsbU (phosphoserine phosphatase)